jgi:hypothetical protein
VSIEQYQASTAQAYEEAGVTAGKATMYAIAHYAREEHPTATVVQFSESDQGAWLALDRVETPESDEEELEDDGGYTSCLYSDVWSLRNLYSEYDVRGAIEYSERQGITSFRMDVAKVLAECAPPPAEVDRLSTPGKRYDHVAAPDSLPGPDDTCKVCGEDITWMGPGSSDWLHVDDEENR